MNQSHHQPVVLITGTSTGVGLHTALRFAAAGYRTVATMRNTKKQDQLLDLAAKAGVDVSVFELDIENPQSINDGVSTIIKEMGRVDVLVNNAGAGFFGSVEQTSDADLRHTMEVNFFGTWNMTKAVFPHMRERGSGRIISMSSVGGLIGQPFNEAYCAAKFAVEGMMEGFAPLARRMGVWVSVVEPGPINTEFSNTVRAASTKLAADITAPYDRFMTHYQGNSKDVYTQYGQSGDDIANIILDAAQTETPHFRYITSEFAKTIVKSKLVDLTGDALIESFVGRLGN